MSAMASQITSVTIVYSTVYSSVDQRKHQSSVSLAFVRGIHRWPVNSPHKGPITRKMFPLDDVIMCCIDYLCTTTLSQTTFSNAFSWMKYMNCDWYFTEVCPRGPFENIPASVQIMAWRRPGDKPLSEPLMVSLLTHMRHSASIG